MKKSLLAISLASLSSVAFSAVLLNETFESIPGAPGAGGYQPLVAATTFSSPGGPTWTVGGDSIDLINAGYNSPAGSTGVDLNGNAAGSITTFISATAGISNFTLTFDYWGNGGAGRTVNWQVGTYAGILTSSASANSSTSLTPNPFSLSWTANAGTTMLVKFTGSENDGASGGTIDNIRLTQDFVAAIPEPGEWAMMLAGLSIVSIIARRRKKE